MKPHQPSRRRILSILMPLLLLLPPGATTGAAQILGLGSGSISALSIPQSGLIQPATLARMLTSTSKVKPLILQVGSGTMFYEGHIPGAQYAGQASEPDGLQSLRSKVASLPRTKLIVVYCGCCPWTHCPNVGPAYHQLIDMGFTHVKVLYLPNNFGTDWVSRGYPVE
ncbi:MAG: rhodanese-like domain-containing protein [Acidobacteriaceae bacterium]